MLRFLRGWLLDKSGGFSDNSPIFLKASTFCAMMISHKSARPMSAAPDDESNAHMQTNAPAQNSAKSAKKSKRQSQNLKSKDPSVARAKAFLKQCLAPYRRTLQLAWLLDVLAVVALVGQVACLSAFFASCLTAEFNGTLTTQLAQTALLAVLPWLGLCLFLRPLLSFFRDKLVSDVGRQMAMSTRAQALARLGELSASRHYYGSDGALASYVIDEPDALVGYARFDVQKKTAVTTPVLLALIVATKSMVAALLLLLTAPLVSIFMALIGIATARKNRAQMDAMAQMGARFLDWLRGVNTLVHLGAVDVAGRDLAQAADAYKTRTMSVLKIAFLNNAVLEWLSALSIALVAVYLGFGLLGILPWAKDRVVVDYHAALFVLLLVPEFYAPLRRLGADYHAKGAAEAAAKQLVHFLGAPKASPDLVVSPVAAPLLQSNASTVGFTHPPEIRLEGLCVVGDDGRVRLPPLSGQLMSGQRAFLMGHSGSGKSTLFAVLLGVCAYQGSALVAGQAVNMMSATDRAAWQGGIAYLAQTPALLPMSIAENLRLACADADDDRLHAVLDKVGLGTLIRALPDGLATKLSERGGGLSGGQAQRLAIAQLLLQDAPLWLLDEPTEHLDKQTRGEIETLLLNVSAGKTVLWATHDAAFVASALASGAFDALWQVGEVAHERVEVLS